MFSLLCKYLNNALHLSDFNDVLCQNFRGFKKHLLSTKKVAVVVARRRSMRGVPGSNPVVYQSLFFEIQFFNNFFKR